MAGAEEPRWEAEAEVVMQIDLEQEVQAIPAVEPEQQHSTVDSIACI